MVLDIYNYYLSDTDSESEFDFNEIFYCYESEFDLKLPIKEFNHDFDYYIPKKREYKKVNHDNIFKQNYIEIQPIKKTKSKFNIVSKIKKILFQN